MITLIQSSVNQWSQQQESVIKVGPFLNTNLVYYLQCVITGTSTG